MNDHFESCRPAGYLWRLLDATIAKLLLTHPIVELIGLKGAGKTWTVRRHSHNITAVDDPFLVPILEAGPRFALTGRHPHALDEWPTVPALRNEAYRAASHAGDYLMVSSHIPHSRTLIYRDDVPCVHLRTLTLSELHQSDESVSLYSLLSGRRFDACSTESRLEQVANIMCQGGWPGMLSEQSDGQPSTPSEQLFSALHYAAQSFNKNQDTLLHVLRAVIQATGSDSTYRTLADFVAKDGASVPARSTMLSYLSALKNSFLIEELSGWDAPTRSQSRAKVKPRFVAADPSIAAELLGFTPGRLLCDAPSFMQLFYALIAHELLVYSDVLTWATSETHEIRYYADADGLAVDFILLHGAQQWSAFVLGLGEAHVPTCVKRLKRLATKVEKGGVLGSPQCLAVILAEGNRAWFDEGSSCSIVPISCLTL